MNVATLVLKGEIPISHHVFARTLVGRSSSCLIRLDESLVSSEHATLFWNGEQWVIRDLGSKNGTFVRGTCIDSGSTVELNEGATLSFGDQNRVWELVDVAAPATMAMNLHTREIAKGTSQELCLPPVEPEVRIYPDGTGDWYAEDKKGERRQVEDQEIVSAGGGTWRVQLPLESEGTPLVELQPSITSISLRFAVSPDKKKVRLTVVHRGTRVALERREHHHVLYAMARARKEDEGLPLDQRGWRSLSWLSQELLMDSNAINVAIHRARQQFNDYGIDGAAGLVEVKRGYRRLGTDRFEVEAL